jgi:hypothetical protein
MKENKKILPMAQTMAKPLFGPVFVVAAFFPINIP